MKAHLYLLALPAWPIAVSAQQAELMDNEPLTMLVFDELELSESGGENVLSWDGDFWVGTDLDRFWVKTEGERSGDLTEEAELELLYSRAVAPFWDLQAGVRQDFRPSPDQTWAAIGIQGLAPYRFEIEAGVYFAEGGQTSLELRTRYELLLTQRLILTPELELSAFGRSDPARTVGSGLNEFELGLRLRYEIKREIAPYLGIKWTRRLGESADIARLAGRDTRDWTLLLGVKFWY